MERIWTFPSAELRIKKGELGEDGEVGGGWKVGGGGRGVDATKVDVEGL